MHVEVPSSALEHVKRASEKAVAESADADTAAVQTTLPEEGTSFNTEESPGVLSVKKLGSVVQRGTRCALLV